MLVLIEDIALAGGVGPDGGPPRAVILLTGPCPEEGECSGIVGICLDKL